MVLETNIVMRKKRKYKKRKPVNYWTKENCIEEARKYKTVKEWLQNSRSSYTIAHKHGWLEECCAHMTPLGNTHNRMVYCYLFPDNCVYVGLTCNHNRRNYQHMVEHDNSAVLKHMLSTNLTPQFIKISDYIPVSDAQKIESLTVKKYRDENYTILNVARTGSLGGNTLKWTKERCIEDAKKYKKRSEWMRKSHGAYRSAKKNGCFEECCAHMITKRKK